LLEFFKRTEPHHEDRFEPRIQRAQPLSKSLPMRRLRPGVVRRLAAYLQ
jgi:hypothetical protein